MPTASSLLCPLITSGFDLQWLGAGLGFPAKDWAGSQWWKHQILGTRPVVSDKGPGFQLCRKEFPQRQNVVKQIFTKRKKSTVSMDRHKGRLRERVPESFPFSGLSYFYGIFFPISFGQSSWLAWFIVHIWHISGSSHVCAHISQPRDFTKKASG